MEEFLLCGVSLVTLVVRIYHPLQICYIHACYKAKLHPFNSVPTEDKMRQILFTLVCIGVSFTAALWPIPRTLNAGTSPLRLSDKFSIKIALSNPPQDLVSAVSTVRSQLQNQTFQRLVVGRGKSDAATILHAPELESLSISLASHASVRPIAEEAIAPLGTRDESYTLNIPYDDSQATLVANSTLGLFRGLTTFAQMWYASPNGKYILDAPVNIFDEPAFVRVLLPC